ncbi:Aste57867_12596 [Aphanomyces stellatus]|uniref:Aste57867_12596 protein n=1 Tax=Aphanomyces stellatus TaxID=120398 RepID=A0A485KWS4_9STRA|nr:hypothetical protein As57867_012550 [Aphanomyces stellatus]VFT89447.1 Aste57867_12596 [Aphanomyces stellatus]
MNPFAAGLALVATALASGAKDCDLKLTSYKFGTKGHFPVSSILVSGSNNAILDSGKTLTTIYIAHGDPDYYFGHRRPHQRDRGRKTKVLGSDPRVRRPKATILPSVLHGNKLELEGHCLNIQGQTDRSYVWIPDLKAVIDGVLLVNNIRAFLADTPTPQSHSKWTKTHKPNVIVPGHALVGAGADIDSPAYTIKYIQDYDAATTKAANGPALTAALVALYLDASSLISLNSAAVAKGELKWP